MSRIGLIAGNGRFPILFARGARENGVELVAVAHQGESLTELDQELPGITWVKVGELQRIINVFKASGITRAVMAGGIHKSALLDHFAPDERAQRMLTTLTAWGDDAILRGVAAELESEGIAIVDSTMFVQQLVAPVGPIAGDELTEGEERDIRLGVDVARALGRYDVGQSVVVKSGMVLAVEAIEGTDATIERGGRAGAIVIKVSKPNQDMRFDVPAVGPRTIACCAAKGIKVLALEAGKTLLLDKEELIKSADASGVKVLGIAG